MQRIRNQQSGSAGKYKTTPLSLRTTRYGMVPNSIENLSQLTIDAQTKLALTTASVKLTIEVDAAGTRVFLADQRSGQMIGGPDDLSKLSGIRAFITRERKDAAGIEIAKRIGEISFKCSQNLISRNPTYVQPPLETNYSATLRPLLIVLERLELNKQKFLENTNLDKREIFEPILKDMFTRIRNAYFAYMIELTTGESKKGMLNTCLFDRGVPEYVHTKLTSQNLILERSQELTRLLFPQDPSKGLQLTVKEWRSLEFRKLLGTYLLRSSGATEKLMRSDAFIRALAKLDHTVDLNDESNVTVQKLLKNRVHVIPPMQESRYVTDAGMKMKGGWKFMTPSTETAQGCLTAVGLAILRIYSATVQSVDLVDDYYQIVANGEVKRSNLSPTNNFFVQWSNSSSDDQNWNEVVTGNGTNDELREALWRWTRLELRLSEKGEVGLQLANVLGLSEDLKTIRPRVSEVPAGHNRNKSDTQRRTVDRVEYKPKIQIDMFEWKATSPMVGLSDVLAKVEPKDEFFVTEYIKKIFPKKKILGKDKKQNNANLTVLTKDSKSLLKQVEKLSKPLSLRMSIWLRSFSDERLQNAASKLALAQFDELFINENIIEEDDQNENDSDAEDSEEEFPE